MKPIVEENDQRNDGGARDNEGPDEQVGEELVVLLQVHIEHGDQRELDRLRRSLQRSELPRGVHLQLTLQNQGLTGEFGEALGFSLSFARSNGRPPSRKREGNSIQSSDGPIVNHDASRPVAGLRGRGRFLRNHGEENLRLRDHPVVVPPRHGDLARPTRSPQEFHARLNQPYTPDRFCFSS